MGVIKYMASVVLSTEVSNLASCSVGDLLVVGFELSDFRGSDWAYVHAKLDKGTICFM